MRIAEPSARRTTEVLEIGLMGAPYACSRTEKRVVRSKRVTSLRDDLSIVEVWERSPAPLYVKEKK